MRALAHFLATAACWAAPALAQGPDRGGDRGGVRGSVRGVVRDSLADRPLGGATIQLAPTGNLRLVRIAVADSLGRFAFDTVGPGPHVIGFVHPDVVALGVDMPLRKLDVTPGAVADVELGLAGGVTLRRALCGGGEDRASAATGALSGAVRDATTGYPLDAVSVTLSWRELRATRGRIGMAPRDVTVRTAVGGMFLFCGAPSGIELTLRAGGPGAGARSTVDLAVTVPPGGLLRQELLLADDGTPADARLTGRVRDDRGRPVAGASASVVGVTAAATTSATGAFALDGLPRGTRTLEVRAVGYAPARVAVTLGGRTSDPVEVELERREATLEPMVVRERARTWLDIEGFDTRRRRHIGGAFLTQEELARRVTLSATDAVLGVRGMQVRPSGDGFTRIVRGRGDCRPDVYVNGSHVRGGADMIDHLLGPHDLLAVEVYAGPGDTPAEFVPAFGGSCGAVVMWTKR